MNGERANELWLSCMAAVKVNDLAKAEEIASQMHIPSDAKLARERIEKQRAATLCGSSGLEPAAHQSKEPK